MTTRTETFNGRREFANAGNYIELISTVNPVDLYTFGQKDEPLNVALQVSQGFVIDRRGTTPFSRFAIVTGANEQVKFSYSDGIETNRSVPADMTDRAVRQVGIVSGNLGNLDQLLQNARNLLTVAAFGTLGQLAQKLEAGINALHTIETPREETGSWNNQATPAALTATQLFSAASNPNGAILLWAECNYISGGNAGRVGFLANATAPANLVTGVNVLSSVISGTAGAWSFGRLARPVKIPAGLGLYFFNDFVEPTNQKCAGWILL